MQKYYFYEDRKRLPGLYFPPHAACGAAPPPGGGPPRRGAGGGGPGGGGGRGGEPGGAFRGQYLKLLPPMNSRMIDVGGISSGGMGVKFFRNFSMRRASSYSGTVSGTSRRIFSA